MKHIGIIGCGTMGSGIAQVAATADCNVHLYDISAEALEVSKTKLIKILDRLIVKERINMARKESILANITYTSKLDDLSNSDLVIEAIIENEKIKNDVFSKLEDLVSDSCIIASNTSSLSITSLAAGLKHSHRFMGLHFFNPAPLMKLVEIIPALQSDTKLVTLARTTMEDWGKTTVLAKDTPGFIVNKVARPFYSEALRMYEEGIADIPTIDWAMRELAGFRMGPFQLMDLIGNDINYTVTETVWKSFYYDPRYKPAFTQKRYAEAGYLGKKSGRGFYDYSLEKQPDPNRGIELGQVISFRIILMLINEAADTLHLNIANKADIETAMTKGVNYPKGLLSWADEIGIDTVVKSIDSLYNEYHEDRYRCSPLLRKMATENSTFFS